MPKKFYGTSKLKRAKRPRKRKTTRKLRKK